MWFQKIINEEIKTDRTENVAAWSDLISSLYEYKFHLIENNNKKLKMHCKVETGLVEYRENKDACGFWNIVIHSWFFLYIF